MSTQDLRASPYGPEGEAASCPSETAVASVAIRASCLLLKALLACAALYHVLLTASTALSSSLPYPFMDQFRLNLRYLTTPFPDNVLALENGHRLIVPGLVRVLELNAFGGWPVLQTATAWCSAVVAGALLLRSVHREIGLATLLGCASACALATLLYSNSNARIFIHAFDAVHVFYIAVFMVGALTLAAGARAGESTGPWLAAIVLCTAATFTFGPGIATFAAVAVIALLRARLGMALAVALSCAAVLVAYQWLLPGASGVRNGVAGASLGLTPLLATARMGAVAAEAVRTLALGHELQRAIGVVTGAVVTVAMMASVARRWRSGPTLTQTELVGIGLFVFGATANALIAVSRTPYFVQYPNELFADRYLFWSCLAWLGAILYALASLRTARPAKQIVASVTVLALSLAMVPGAAEINEWASNVRRMSETQAVAWRLNLRMDERLAELTDGDVDIAYRSLDEMRRRRLNLFANAPTLALGEHVSLSSDVPTVPIQTERVPTDEPEHRGATLVSGVLPPDVDSRHGAHDLWLATAEGRVIGAAAFTWPGDEAPTLGRFGRATLRGFHGYVYPPLVGELYLIRADDGRVRTLAHLVPQP